jgi:biotin carboxyl carrier protein
MTQYKYKINGKEYTVMIDSVSDDSAQVTVNGKCFDVEMLAAKEQAAEESYTPITRAQSRSVMIQPAQPKDKKVKSPLPGTILAIKVKIGDTVKEGQTLAVLEAMKMENEIQAEHDGVISEIHVEKGDSVLEGTVIITIK